MSKNNNKKIFLIISSVIIVFVIFFILNNQEDSEVMVDKKHSEVKKTVKNGTMIEASNEFLKISKDDHILGDKNAPVKIIEYASLSCPHCAEFHVNGFNQLKQDYIEQKKVALIYRDFPLNGPALAGAIAAKCYVNKVKKDDKYHSFITNLFKNQEKWAFLPDFMNKLKEISQIQGLSSEEFTKCIEDNDMQKTIITKTQETSKSLQIRSTPTFIINGESISGYTGWDDLKFIIDRKLSEKKE